ncbi:cytochrome P450 [Pelagicoccus sp. SDUM812002]|uniref:cytochrome P450 n=1 Tax=Pelagicoccus sp. SDUM812002 TaxID=3041266 RepID=UPI00280FA282|nr:cytochrome P450 [Pelagicoccus sp. SDUM812002]MDQ8188429.1 cytochrome P450 [Pelagicoccus sp. SDUM812002]
MIQESPPPVRREIPHGGLPESTLPFLMDPYGFIPRVCRSKQTDLFETRIQFEKTICMSGTEAAEVFYDTSRFSRANAAPSRIQKTLFGEGGVQGLDGDAHLRRKSMFLELVEPDRVRHLSEIFERHWELMLDDWESRGRLCLYDEMRCLLTRAVCEWAGVPLSEEEEPKLIEDLTSLFADAGSVGPRHWKSRRARRRTERWAGELLQKVRNEALEAPAGSALLAIAQHRDENGKQLDLHVASVELLNVLRPTVAVSVYIAFAAVALNKYPVTRDKLIERREGYDRAFAQEVRRYYPFFPVVAARVSETFEWKGYTFPEGRLVVLDLYGTNHDPKDWDRPDAFLPERFPGASMCPFHFIPQGGGDPLRNHRCPGEGVAIELIQVAARFLTLRLDYTLPSQDLSVDRKRLPALPKSKVILSEVRRSGRF